MITIEAKEPVLIDCTLNPNTSFTGTIVVRVRVRAFKLLNGRLTREL